VRRGCFDEQPRQQQEEQQEEQEEEQEDSLERRESLRSHHRRRVCEPRSAIAWYRNVSPFCWSILQPFCI
jgi:hypothetical protein